MAGNGYSSLGYSTYNTPQIEEWIKTSYASDRVCQPIIIDPEGRRRSVISCTPTENPEIYVIKAERIGQEQVNPPVSSEYKYGSRPAPDLVEDYGVGAYGAGKRWQQPNDRPEKVEEFLVKVQTEASRPRFGPVDASYWRTPAGNTGGYDEFNDQTNTEWNTPYGNSYRNEKPRNYPAMVTSDEWTRPSQSLWAAPPGSSLSKPTNNINTAMRVLQEAARPSAAPKPRPLEQAYAQTIDSKEAARRYGNYNFGPRPSVAEPTIDSREAARKYRGTTV